MDKIKKLLNIKDNKYYEAKKYSLLFVVFSLIIFSPFIIMGQSFIWGFDGAFQHVIFLSDIVSTIRESFSSGFAFWNWNLGLGADTITSYAYYGLFDVLNLIALAFPIKYMEAGYTLIALVRLYLVGITFLYLAKEFKFKRQTQIIGTLVYVFSSFTLFSFIRHPFFATAPLTLPLLILFTERIYKNKSYAGLMFIVTVFFSLLAQYYFFYMSVIFTIMYVVLRYFNYNKFSFKGFIKTISKFGIFAVAGVLLASFMLFPTASGFLTSARSASKGLITYNYGVHLPSLLKAMVTAYRGSAYTFIYFSFAAVLMLPLLFKQKGNKTIKTLIIFGYVGLLINIIGYIFSLFNYVNNRWSYAIIMFAVLGFMFAFEKFDEVNKKDARNVVIISSVLALILALFVNIGFAIRVLAISYPVYWAYVNNKIKPQKAKKVLVAIILTLIIIPQTVLMITYSSEFLSRGHWYDSLSSQPENYLEINHDDFYRIDKNQYSFIFDIVEGVFITNDTVFNNFSSTQFYSTIANKYYIDYLTLNEVKNNLGTLGYTGTNYRSAIDALTSVRYFASVNPNIVPYGYSLMNTVEVPVYETLVTNILGFSMSGGPNDFKYDENNEIEMQTAYLYENQNYLPIAYAYENYITTSQLEELDVLDRQFAMLSAIVIEDNENLNLTNNIPNIDYDLQADVIINTNQNVVDLINNIITINNIEELIEINFNNATLGAEFYLALENIVKKEESNFQILYDYNGINFRSSIYKSGHQKYFENKNHYVCFGANNNVSGTIYVQFTEEGEYSFDGINVISYDLTDLSQTVTDLKNNALQNIEVSSNNVTGNIELNSSSIVNFSIPYTTGWTAYVNGEEVEMLKTNVGFMGIALEAGVYDIELKYSTPGLKYGVIVSLGTLLMVVGLYVLIYIKKEKKKNLSE